MAAKKRAAKQAAKKPTSPKSKSAAKKQPAKKSSAKKPGAGKPPAKAKPPAAKAKAKPKSAAAQRPAPKAPPAKKPEPKAAPKAAAPAPAPAPVAAKPAAPAVAAPAPVAAKPAASADPAAPKHGGISDESVRSATGRGWADWFTLIDSQGGATLDHRGIVAIVAPHLQKSEWWAQMVTVAYEQARGLRKKHEKTDGFQVGASRVLEVSVSRIYAAFFDPTLRARWLPDPVTIKAATPDKSLRMSWKDNTPIDVYLYAKGEDRASVAVQHGKIKDEATAAERKAFWKAALERLAALLVRR